MAAARSGAAVAAMAWLRALPPGGTRLRSELRTERREDGPGAGELWPAAERRGGGCLGGQGEAAEAEAFRLVYRFPGIRYCRLLSRLKLLQTGAALAVLPPVCYLHLRGQAPPGLLAYTGGVALLAGAMLYGMSYYFRRVIGLIYLSRDGRNVRVSHLTFWGRRNDLCCPVEAVMPLAEVGDRKGEPLLQFKRYDSADVLYFTVRFGQIVDREGFTQIFGELE
ncbi:transmembrane protein 186 [Opisthocomus hoazin]|uniref:transmembrane protein 186 n=1 Tax=Opisthocomus hoazin TaxID=30419 RepID=UPI003F539322